MEYNDYLTAAIVGGAVIGIFNLGYFLGYYSGKSSVHLKHLEESVKKLPRISEQSGDLEKLAD